MKESKYDKAEKEYYRVAIESCEAVIQATESLIKEAEEEGISSLEISVLLERLSKEKKWKKNYQREADINAQLENKKKRP